MCFEGLASKYFIILTMSQEGWLAQNVITEMGPADEISGNPPADPMQGLEGLDVAGPRK